MMKRRNFGENVTDEVLNIEEVMKGFLSGDKSLVLENLPKVKSILARKNVTDPIRYVCHMPGAVDLLFEIFQNGNENERLEAIWCLTNLCSEGSDETEIVVAKGLLPIVIQSSLNDTEVIRDQCMWALANVSGEGVGMRDLILNHGGAQSILANLGTDDKDFLRTICWTASNLCRGNPRPDWNSVGILMEPLCKALKLSYDTEALIDICWALSYLIDRDDEKVPMKYFLATVDLDIVVSLLAHSDPVLVHAALRIIGNIAQGSDDQTTQLLQTELLEHLVDLMLGKLTPKLQKEICWLLSNITATGEANIQKVMDQGTHFQVFQYLVNAEWNVQKESFYFFYNIITEGESIHAEELFNIQGFLEAYMNILYCSDKKIIALNLESLDILLSMGKNQNPNPMCEVFERAGAFNVLEYLQESQNEDIFLQARSLIEDYFTVDEEFITNPENFQQTSTQETYQF